MAKWLKGLTVAEAARHPADRHAEHLAAVYDMTIGLYKAP